MVTILDTTNIGEKRVRHPEKANRPDTEVLRIAQTLREKRIPADGITLDIHYMDRYQLFTWDKERFPDPVGLNNKLKQMGFTTTVIVDPGIKTEPGAPAFERGLTIRIAALPVV